MIQTDFSTFDIFPYFEAGASALPLFKNQPMKKNDCYQCPHREQVPGSAHSRCKVLTNDAIAFAFAMKVASGEFTGMDNNEGQALKFDPHGVKMGWCAWPINFDPVWVECHLPIENNEKQ